MGVSTESQAVPGQQMFGMLAGYSLAQLRRLGFAMQNEFPGWVKWARIKQGGIMSDTPKKVNLSEDWWAVILAFVLILLAVIGMLGANGLNITF